MELSQLQIESSQLSCQHWTTHIGGPVVEQMEMRLQKNHQASIAMNGQRYLLKTKTLRFQSFDGVGSMVMLRYTSEMRWTSSTLITKLLFLSLGRACRLIVTIKFIDMP